MPDTKISNLPLGIPTASDYVPYVDNASGITRKATKANLVGPQGSQGSIGSMGATGATGPQGSQGSIGSIGATGGTGYAVPRVISNTSTLTPTPNADITDTYKLTAQAGTAGFVTPSGSPVDSQKILIEIWPTGSNRNITFDSGYTAGGVPLPTSATQGKKLTIGFEYDTANSFNKWMCIGSSQQI